MLPTKHLLVPLLFVVSPLQLAGCAADPVDLQASEKVPTVQSASPPTAESVVRETPRTPVRAVFEGWHFNAAIDIYFPPGSALLNAKGEQSLTDYWIRYSNVLCQMESIRIVGHADSTGTKTRNSRLAYQRADAVARWFHAKRHFAHDKIEVVGRGDTLPVASNRTEQGRANNRRVEVEMFGLPSDRRPKSCAL